MPLLLRIHLLFLSASWIPIHPKVPSSKLTLAQKPTWSHHFSEPSVSHAYTHCPLTSSLNKYVLVTSHVPALLEALGTLWRTWLRPHRTRGPGTDCPRPCVQHILCSVLGCCIIRSHALLLSPCPDSKLHIGKTSFFHLFMHPSIPHLFRQAPWEHQGCTRHFKD